MYSPVERLAGNSWMPPWTRHEHIARYEWAAKLAEGRLVVDAACGSGFGAGILLDGGAAGVEGFDLSPEAIAEAETLHARKESRFAVADVTKLPCPDHHCDLFLSFETIEHVEDDRALLREVKRVLKPAGTFVCSTPNRLVTNPGISIAGKPYNCFHLREYTRSDLESRLREFFRSVTFLGQSFHAAGYIRILNRLGRCWPMSAVRVHQARKVLGAPWEKRARHRPVSLPAQGEPEVLIAVCGQDAES